METTSVQLGSTTCTSGCRGFQELNGEDFFKVLIAQLVNQDPLEPTSNQELLAQMASIREIELNSSLTDSLKNLTSQQQFGSASSLIGRSVTGPVGEDGTAIHGQVVSVRFEADGRVYLQLDSGQELNLADVVNVTDAEQMASDLIGLFVQGTDTRDPNDVRDVEGLVTSVQTQDGELVLELDTGDSIRFRDVTAVKRADTASGTTWKPLKALKELLTWD
jgi:flagellar basal-body rod modification protein FlgD